MLSVHVNYIAIVVATLANMILGWLWYSKTLFGQAWMKLTGVSESKMKDGQKAMGLMVVVSLIEAFVLARFITIAGETTTVGGGKIGLWVWIGFVATVTSGMVLFEGKPLKLYYIVAGYQLVSFVVMGAIIASMGY